MLDTLEADETWDGVTPSMAVEALHQRTGVWMLRQHGVPHPGRAIDLSSTARLASQAEIVDRQFEQTGEPCGIPKLEVPLFVELESLDGAWRFSGEVVHEYQPGWGWSLYADDRNAPRTVMQVEAADHTMIPDAWSGIDGYDCDDELVMKLSGGSSATDFHDAQYELTIGVLCYIPEEDLNLLSAPYYGRWIPDSAPDP